MSFVNVEQGQFWSEMAPTWAELEDQLEEVTATPGLKAMDRLPLTPGQQVVDLGCGLGRTTLELASRVAPSGEALGVDIANEMLDFARERAERSGVENVTFSHADVQVHALGDARFDAAYSRFGVMFFADPIAAFSNVREALRPGGGLSFVCWQSVFDNEWMLVPGMAAMSVVGEMPLPNPGEPGPFSLSDPERIRTVLQSAGFGQVQIYRENDSISISEDRIPEIARTSTRVSAVREALREADDATHARVLDAIEEALRRRCQNGEVRASRGILLARATA